MISDKILERVKNLLSLANSDNAHEANLALERAHDMIREHNIKDADLFKKEKKEITVDCEIVPLAEYGYPWSRSLFTAVARAYHCKPIYIKVPSKINPVKENYAANLFGTKGDRETVKLMYSFAVDAKMRIQKTELKRAKKEREYEFELLGANAYMRDFNYGVVAGMCATLREIADHNDKDKETKGSAYGLVLVTTAIKVKELFDKKYPDTKKMRGGSPQGTGANNRGYEKGSQVGFNKQVSGQTKGYLK